MRLPLLVVLASSLLAPQANAQAAADEYVVVLAPEADGPGMAEAHGAFHRYSAVFNGFAARLAPNAVHALLNNPRVISVERAFTVTSVAETVPAGVDRIDAERAHAVGQAGAGARVAVVDSGIDLDHPDLAANIDRTLSKTFVSKGSTTIGGDDDQGHGTHVAGTIAAIDNDIQVVGVAPAARLIALKVLNRQGSGSSTDIIAALDFITNHNNNVATSYAEMIHVANFSLGGSGTDTDTAYRRAFQAAVASGCFIVVAAGNSTADSSTFVPAAYDSVLTVSAMDPLTGGFASFSNFGSDVDVGAPGVGVVSTTLGGGTGAMDGTSMASPHAAGVAALYVGQQLASLTKATAVATIRAALLGSAEPIVMAGDKDGIREPLVDAEAILGPVGDPDPAVGVSIVTDKVAYSETDTQAVLTVSVVDEHAAPISGLPSTSLTLTGATVMSFEELGGGDYAFTIDIAGFALGVGYVVSVTATDARLLTGQDTTTITRVSTPVIHVSNIAYISTKSALKITVSIVDAAGFAVSGASVSITVTRDGANYGSATSTTDAAGQVSFNASRAPSGRYVTRVTAVTKAGTIYDPTADYIDGGFTR